MFRRFDHSPGCSCPACLRIHRVGMGGRHEGSLRARFLSVLIALLVIVVIIVLANVLGG